MDGLGRSRCAERGTRSGVIDTRSGWPKSPPLAATQLVEPASSVLHTHQTIAASGTEFLLPLHRRAQGGGPSRELVLESVPNVGFGGDSTGVDILAGSSSARSRPERDRGRNVRPAGPHVNLESEAHAGLPALFLISTGACGSVPARTLTTNLRRLVIDRRCAGARSCWTAVRREAPLLQTARVHVPGRSAAPTRPAKSG